MHPEQIRTSLFPEACRAINGAMNKGRIAVDVLGAIKFISEIAGNIAHVTKLCIGLESAYGEEYDPKAEERHCIRNGLEL